MPMDSQIATMAKCRICGCEDSHPTFIGKEMMFGTREEFIYFKCSSCGCLQIKDIPSDLYKYYGDSYYSFNKEDNKKSNGVIRLLHRERCRNALFGKGYKLNKILSRFIDLPKEIHSVRYLLQHANLNSFNDRILDIGCGITSWWLSYLYELGFNDLTGIDPFIPHDNISANIKIYKKEINEVSEKYDLITLHHSLEHIADQSFVMDNISRILSDEGVCIIRIPIVSSFVWENYGTNWVEMDPPRHLYLHTNESIELLAKESGLKLIETEYDSIPLEFYGSEQYVKGIPLSDPNSYWTNEDSTIFTPEELNEFTRLSKYVNENRIGGRASFFFKKIT
jgi:SAM-dependent methyltransferase